MRAAHRARTSPPTPSAVPRPPRDVDVLMEFYKFGREGEGLRHTASRWCWRACSHRRSSSTASRRSRQRAGRAGVSHQRHRPGVAAVVLPVEHGAGRRAAEGGRRGRLREPAVLERAGAAHAEGSEGRRAGGELRRPVAEPARRSTPRRRCRSSIRTSTIRCARRCAGRWSCCSTRSCARIAASSICSTPTTRSSTSGWPSTTASRTSPAASSVA